ncbi:MAG: epoxyqueuosine reductase QueH [candidate division KSB1 bacterium]|nr:epoxyqueuosine reductase QueH [candidate division KSB1 bacterium]MDZ7356448.1 epoxyqueuosine reductase QueH [candidate division KSB1 bacterium]
MEKPKLLLHTCCAPCVTVPRMRLQDEYDIYCFFYNPNIHPEQEYLRRLAELKRIARQLSIVVIEQPYDVDRWMNLIRGLESAPERGQRCQICYRMRLEATAQFAKQEGIEYFTTTLTISPHKDATMINRLGEELAGRYGVHFLSENFKKKDGYKQSLELSAQFQLYRQDYCGCIFSQRSHQRIITMR